MQGIVTLEAQIKGKLDELQRMLEKQTFADIRHFFGNAEMLCTAASPTEATFLGVSDLYNIVAQTKGHCSPIKPYWKVGDSCLLREIKTIQSIKIYLGGTTNKILQLSR